MSRSWVQACVAVAIFGTACASHPPATAPAREAGCALAGDAVQVVRDMYTALAADDAAAASRLFAPDFYAFDGGERYTGPSLFAMIKSLHADGKVFVWEVVATETHRAGDMAWVTWENQGSISGAAITWLESAVLRCSDGGWRMAFFQSTRAKR